MTTTLAESIFDRMDKGEVKVGRSADQFNADDLLAYVQEMHRIVYRRPYPIREYQDRSIARRIIKSYGPDAGRMVKFLFHRLPNYRSRSFDMNWFAVKAKWITEDIMQQMHSYESSFAPVEHDTEHLGLKGMSALRSMSV